MDEFEVRRVNNSLLIRLCREVGEKEKISKIKAKQCSLIINDAITKLKEV